MPELGRGKINRMDTEAILLELADILNAPPGSLTPETRLESVTWDSMALLAYLAFLRFHFNRTRSGVSCADFRTVGDLLAGAQPDA